MKNTKRQAFTIVELVIVIAVISILSAVLIPTFGAIIKNANIAADQAEAASLTTQLAMDLDGIHSADELYATIAKVYGEEAAKKFAPRSAQDGYHYWYDAKTKRVELAKYSELQGIIDRTADFSTGAVESGIALMSAVAIDAPALDYTPFAVGDLRSVVNNRFYLIDKMADSIVNDLNSLDTCNTVVDKFVNGSYENNSENALAQDILTNLSKVVIANDNGMFAYDEDVQATTLYTPNGTTNISDNATVYGSDSTTIDLSGITSVVLPESIIDVQSYSMNDFADGTTIIIDTTEQNLVEIFAAESTNCVIHLPNGDSYAVEGNSIVKLGVDADGNTTKTTIATDLEYTIPVKDMTLTPIETNKLNLGTLPDGTQALYVAVDYTGDIALSVLDFVDENNYPLDLDIEATWAVKSGNLTYEDGKFKVTGFADSNDAYVGEIAVSVQTLTKTIPVYGVKALNVKVDTSDNEGLDIKDIDQTNVLITLSYNPTADNTFNFTPSLVHNHLGTSIVLDNQPTVTDSQGKMSYSYDTTTSKGTLKLPAGSFEGKVATTLNVYYGGEEISTQGNVIYTVQLINNLDDTFAINETYVTTQTHNLANYYVGNSGEFELSYLFKAIKEIPSGQKIIVEVLQAGQSNPYVYEFTGLDGKLNLNKEELTNLVNNVIKIKIGLTNSPDRTELEVYFVTGQNVTSSIDDAGTNIVLLNDVSLTKQKTFTNIYGNLHKINVNNGNTKTNAYWHGFLKVQGTMRDTLFLGPVYDSVGYHGWLGGVKNGWDGVNPTGNAQIINSYIFGFRAPVVMTGSTNVLIKDSTIEGGTMANIHVAGSKFTLENVALIQDKNGYTTGSKEAYGMGIFCDDEANCTIVIKGTTKFYNWISQADADNLNAANNILDKLNITPKDVVEKMISNGTDFIHNGYINTGIIINVKDESKYVITVTDETNTIARGNSTFTYMGSSYYGYSYKTCNAAVGSETHPELPNGWTSQTNNNYKNFLKVREITQQ